MAENLAPVVLFVYNRPWHTEQTLRALEKNELAKETILYIYADGPKNEVTKEQNKKIQEVRSIITQNWKFKRIEVIAREENWGLADNIVDGVTFIVKKYGKIIVLEDDIVTAVGFLKYMNDALALYEREEKVMHISGYMFPVKGKLPTTFFYGPTSCWGWATWARAWGYYNNDAVELCAKIKNQGLVSKFDIENTYSFFGQLKANASGQLKTWAVRWYASSFLNGGFALHPYPTLTQNIGHDGNGENCEITDDFSWKKMASKILVEPIQIIESQKARQKMIEFHIGFNNREYKERQKIKDVILRIMTFIIKHLYRVLKDLSCKLIKNSNL
jgi:hypothetical protein